jgi:ABC-type Zn uptake system ZnuABC Zn-binding protein ZnuA
MDPVNGKTYALNIKNALVQLMPEHAHQLMTQYNAYVQQLDSLIAYVQQQIETIPPQRRIVITSHDSFQYYGRRFGMQLESVLGTSTDADVRTSDLIRLNEVIRESEVPVVFIESTINPKLLEQVAKDNNISIGGKLYSDSLGDEDSPADTYINMVRHNTDTIVKGLTSDPDPIRAKPSSGRAVIWIIGGIGLLLLLVITIYILRRKAIR